MTTLMITLNVNIPLRVWIRVFDLVRIARCRWFDSGTTRAFYESLNLEAPESQYDSLVRLRIDALHLEHSTPS